MPGALPCLGQHIRVRKRSSLQRCQRRHGFKEEIARAFVEGQIVDQLHDVGLVPLAGCDVQHQQVRQTPMRFVGALGNFPVLQDFS